MRGKIFDPSDVRDPPTMAEKRLSENATKSKWPLPPKSPKQCITLVLCMPLKGSMQNISQVGASSSCFEEGWSAGKKFLPCRAWAEDIGGRGVSHIFSIGIVGHLGVIIFCSANTLLSAVPSDNAKDVIPVCFY